MKSQTHHTEFIAAILEFLSLTITLIYLKVVLTKF